MKLYKYIKENDVVCFARETNDTKGLTYDIWTSRIPEWLPSETAAGVFIGFEDGIWTNITEQKVRAIINQYRQKVVKPVKQINRGRVVGVVDLASGKIFEKPTLQKIRIKAARHSPNRRKQHDHRT